MPLPGRLIVFPLLLMVRGLTFPQSLLQAQSAANMIDFDHQIRPILAANCLPCHREEKRSGGLSLASWTDTLAGGRSGTTVEPGNSGTSLLMQRITGEAQPRMPLGRDPLSASEVAAIRSWIDQGARATPTSAAAKPKWKAPLAIVRPALPEAHSRDWTSPIDRFVAAYFEKNGVSKQQVVSDRLFARRVYVDILGLLPSPEELREFIRDPDVGKRQALVSALLADNRNYGENWISFWNDLLHNDEGSNYHSEMASRKSITGWLLASLESNLPYDQFVGKLLNPIAPADPDGFLIGVNWRGAISASQTPAMQAAQNTAQIFLGVNLKCNSCHDSFISNWKLKDAYGMASYFSTDAKLELYRCDVAQQTFAKPTFLFPELNRAPASDLQADRRAAAASIFTDPKNGRLPRTVVNRVWLRMFGRGLVENPDEMDAEPWSPELLDWLASDFVDSGYDLKHLIATITQSRTYQLEAEARGREQPSAYVFHGPEVRRLTAEQFGDAIGEITGEWHVYQPANSEDGRSAAAPPHGLYSREWRIAASPLARALGRPIRDQVYSTRDMQSTTLQALELVNGETLTHWLQRGAKNMLGELPPEPESLFSHSFNKGGEVSFDVDISRAKKLWLLVQDTGSYSPERVEAVWSQAELVGASGTIPLAQLKPVDSSGLRSGVDAAAIRVKTPSRVVFDVSGQGFTRLRGKVGIENREITSDTSPQVQFFLFEDEPNMERLTPVAPERPVTATTPPKTRAAIADRVFWFALGRAPDPAERDAAMNALNDAQRPGQPSADGLADLLWAVLMKPEFQLIY